jgi:hypothetical protein
MKLLIYALGIVALSPVVAAIAFLAWAFRNAKPAPGINYPYDDDDPGVDVDCPAGEQVCTTPVCVCGCLATDHEPVLDDETREARCPCGECAEYVQAWR